MSGGLETLPGKLGTLGNVVAGLGAASDAASGVLQRGGDNEQALWSAGVSGGLEAATEGLSRKYLSGLGDRAAAQGSANALLGQSAVGAAEETAASVGNIVADRLIMGDKSKWSQQKAAYQAQGDTEAQAGWKTLWDSAKQVGADALGGFLTDATLGGLRLGSTYLDGEINGLDSQITKWSQELEAAQQEQKRAELQVEYDKYVPQAGGEQRALSLPESKNPSVQQELTQMQNRKQLDELAAVYEENVPLLSDVSANAIISDKNSTLKGGSDSGETRKETRTDFDRRCHEEGITVYEGKQVSYGVRLVRGESAQQNARQVQKEVEALGINAVIVDGEIQYNQDNVTGTSTVPEAATIGRRQIVIGNSVSLPAKNVAGHEAFHLWGNTEAREQYVDIITTNLLYDSEEFDHYQKAIVKEYFEKHENVDITDPAQAAKLMEEINAYISGDIHEGVNDDMLRPMFRDYDAVKAAWNKLVEQNGKRAIP